MSKKIKASSKNKKAPAKKVVKKTAPKKVVAKKKATKPVAKTKPVKKTISKAKPAPKKVVAKKPVKKIASKKAVKKAPVKKIVAKKVTSKKAVAKKIAPKKSTLKVKPTAKRVIVKSKPVKKVAPKKIAKPIAPKKVEKVVPAKIKEVKAAKPVVEKVVKEKVSKSKPTPTPLKKQIVAPTTYRVEEANIKPVKEPAGKFEMEFVVRASEDMVYEFVSTESGLSEWFCDDVNIRNGIFTFTWDGQTQQARLVKEMPPFFIRYQWLDKNDGSYFEFKTQKDELTNDISLIITDFADNKADEESARLLWHSQVDKLLHVLGSFF